MKRVFILLGVILVGGVVVALVMAWQVNTVVTDPELAAVIDDAKTIDAFEEEDVMEEDVVEDVEVIDVVVEGQEAEIVVHSESEGVLSADGPWYPEAINLAVPFTPQAPFANWDLPYQEACEEASAYMAYLYFQGEPEGLVNPGTADEALWDLVEFQLDYFGDYLDTTAEQTREFIDVFYNMTAQVIEDPTVEQIKAEIASGRPVMIPAAGKQLGNPYFSGDGPVYHMLIIRGYTEDQFITNDPGTKNGENFAYDIDVIMEAIGDWNDGDPAQGAKRIIFLAR